MKLIEALKTVGAMKARGGQTFHCFLATGSNPLHLSTFLSAELSLLLREYRIETEHGLYGDFPGNLGRLAQASGDCGIILMEWSDLDPRLGIRSGAVYSQSVGADIVATVRARAEKVHETVESARMRMPVVLCPPTLPLLPLTFTPGWQASSLEIELGTIVQTLVQRVSEWPQVRVLSAQRLNAVAPLRERYDVEADLQTGFPYKLTYASALAQLLALLAHKPAPRKGLITDLDDTLWRGLLGEVGVEGISWDLDHHSQIHAFYQRMLGALASEGVLVAAASKNDPALVREALNRKGLALPADALFPVEAHWQPKSVSVTRILKAWNIGADSVVFVDDSPLELAEVRAAHPEIECLQFPTQGNAAVYELAVRLRDLFGKSVLTEEDALRAESIRRAHAGAAPGEEVRGTASNFVAQIESEVTFDYGKMPLDPRALELVNKTNQFNLNGKRFTEAAWYNYHLDPGSFLLILSYSDKFGPLGKISVVAGRQAGERLLVEAWVMSCRAFSRQIEHRCLEELFSRFDVAEIEFAFGATERNGPLQTFLTEVLGEPPSAECRLGRSRLSARRTSQTMDEVAHE